MSSAFDEIFKSVAKATKDEKEKFVSIHKAGDLSLDSHIPYGILTGIPELDFNIGRPGWPAGRCIELFGFEHSGKTTVALHAIAQAQKAGGSGFFIDTEKTWDENRAIDIGINTDHGFGIADADSIEAVFRTIQRILTARQENNDGKPFIIAVDSITGTATEGMHAKSIGDNERVGQDARAIRGGMRRVMADIGKTKTCLFMINHAISTIASNPYAKQSDSSGGHGIKLLSTVRCHMSAYGWIKDPADKERRLGQVINIKVEKLKGSKLDYPEVKKISLLNSIGFDTAESLLTAGIKSGWVDHKESSKTYKLGDIEFPKADWTAIIGQHGGIDAAYREFITWCINEGHISPWSQPIS